MKRSHAPSPTAVVVAPLSSSHAGGEPATETATPSHHSLTINGHTLKYHATAGTLMIRDGKNQPQASVFYVADTLDGARPAQQPLTVLCNGSPARPAYGGFGFTSRRMSAATWPMRCGATRNGKVFSASGYGDLATPF